MASISVSGESLLTKPNHVVQVGDVLLLHNKVFPYPPFTDYEWTTDYPSNKTIGPQGLDSDGKTKPVEIKRDFIHDPNVGEGGAHKENVSFTFREQGTFQIRITELSRFDEKYRNHKEIQVQVLQPQTPGETEARKYRPFSKATVFSWCCC